MGSYVRQLFAGMEHGNSSYYCLRFDLVSRMHSFILTANSRLFSINRTNCYDKTYRSLANTPFASSQTPFASKVHSYWRLGIFPGRASLTKVDMSCEFLPSC